MSVREYVGARYVPLFADPLQWDSTKTYEPLTVVYHQGNSYTSRQAVPAGIEISNETYWALTGNYNAQIEQYRSEVQTFDERINANEDNITAINAALPNTAFDSTNTVKKYIDDNIEVIDDNIKANSGISYVGNYGAKEKDDTVNWQEIIDAIAEVSHTLNFGAGQWYINEELTIPQNIYRVVGDGSVISVNSNIETLFSFDYPSFNDRFFFLNGLKIIGNDNVDTIFYFSNTGNSCHVTDCSFSGFNQYAINSTVLGANVSNCYFANYENSMNEAIGISTLTDSFISNCKFFHMGTGVKIGENSIINGCYFFNAFYTNYVTAIEVTTGSLQVTECEFDCISIIIKLNDSISMLNLDNNNFYWNNTDDTLNLPHYIFYSDTVAYISSVSFCKNFIHMSNTPISNVIYSFSSNIYGGDYHSKENATKINLTTDDARLQHLAIACGFNKMPNVASNVNKFIKFTKTSQDSNSSIEIVNARDNATFYRVGTTTNYIKIGHTNGADQFVAYTNDSSPRTTPFYLTNFANSIYEINFANSLYNMNWYPENTEPDSSYTKTISVYQY